MIELLVVISIIGILSSFAMVSLNGARLKARDALRKGDMAQLRTALALYYDDNLHYPICDGLSWNPGWGSGDDPVGSSPDDGSDCYNNTLAPALGSSTPPIMQNVPYDPSNESNNPASAGGQDELLYRYISNSRGTEYAIIYYLEEDLTEPQIIRGW